MTRHLILPSLAALAPAVMLPGVGAAQSTIQTPAALSDADALAAQMRIIAAEPTDVAALAQAGELSARLGDLSGAASLFARADKVDPHNGRVKAGMAEVLLRSERPGEALRFFDQAEGYGYPPARFAAERGLAYDLLGQQGRAQRDYRLVLAVGENAEVRRRYALSLAISGQNEAALQQLDPLIRKNDRGAWRSRAFIMAMAGDAAGADSIATTMMAPGQAQGLAPFFARLSSLGSVDRAFAVHFGELRPTAQRIADARLAPALPPFAPEVVQVARAAPVAPPAPVRVADRRHRRKGEVQVAAAAPVSAAPAPLPPSYGYAGGGRSTGAPAGVAPASVAPARKAIGPAPAPVALAAAAPPARLPPAVAAPVRTSGFGAPFYYPGSMLPHYLPRPPAAPAVAAVQPVHGAGPSSMALASVPSGTSRPTSPPASAVPVAAVRPTASPVPATDAPRSSATPAQLASVTPSPSASPAPAPAPAPVQLAALRPRPSAGPVQLAAVAPPSAGFSPASVGIVVPSAAGPVRTSAPAIVPAAPVATTPVPVPSAASSTMAPSAAGPVLAPPGATTTGDAVLARIAEALAIPGRDLAAAGTATPVTPVAEAPTSSSAATPVAAQRLSTDFPPEPMMVNGQLTTAGRAATARRHRIVEIAASAPPPVEKDASASGRATGRPEQVAAAGAASAPDPSVESEHPPARHGRRSTVAATDVDAARPGAAAADPPPTHRGRRETAAADTAEPTSTRSRHGSHASTDETGDDDAAPPDRKATARQTAADRKAAAEKKAAVEKKSLAERAAADERKSKKAEPGRYWVQVAGGANEDDLPKAWSAAKSKAPALAARKGWTTPLHATNRVVTGPFKTDEEARAFVNTLKKQGVSAFPFTSEAGQKISRLDDK